MWRRSSDNAIIQTILESPSTSDKDLLEAARELKIPLNLICYKDQLNHYTPKYGAYIINLDDSTSDNHGTHWCGLYLTSHGKNPKMHMAYWFDSYGGAPTESVKAFCIRFDVPKILYSNKQIQNLKSGYCGQYVIEWLYEMTYSKYQYQERYQRFLLKYKIIRVFNE